MADGQKVRDLPEGLVECEVTAHNHDSTLKPEVSSSSSPTSEEAVSVQSPSGQLHPGLLSMPCLLKELSRDSMPDAPPSTMGSTPSVIQLCPQEDSDSSACLRSPTSSGHLGDSDTLSSAEEEGRKMGEAGLAPASCCDPTPRKSSRRSRSESDATAGVGMAAKKNRCQEKQPNGTRSRGRGHRSQRQKERMRMLRQKREAAAKRKPRTLQDSSTSDSDATAHSSSSSASSDRARDSIYLHPAVGPAVIGHYDVSDTNSDQTQRPRALSGPVEVAPPQVSLPLTDSEVEIVGVQENASAVCHYPRGGVIQSLASWKQSMVPPWTAVSAPSDWVPAPEVVDLTLDEDRLRYLL